MSALLGDILFAEAEEGVTYRFDAIESTNVTLKRLAAEGAAHGTVVTARRQTGGKGRHGRSWESPEGNLYMSVLWRPKRAQAEWSTLALVAGIALHRSVAAMLEREHVAPEALRLKWPNDLLYQEKKLGGILLEAEGTGVIVGIGVNMQSHPEGMPYPATSLAAAGLMQTAPAGLLQRLSTQLDQCYGIWQRLGFAALRDAWLERALPVGTKLSLRLPENERQGIMTGLAEDGALLLETSPGVVQRVMAGEVFPVDGRHTNGH